MFIIVAYAAIIIDVFKSDHPVIRISNEIGAVKLAVIALYFLLGSIVSYRWRFRGITTFIIVTGIIGAFSAKSEMHQPMLMLVGLIFGCLLGLFLFFPSFALGYILRNDGNHDG